ncbi:MAG: hypothetical protein ACK4ZM_01520 [bacterium]
MKKNLINTLFNISKFVILLLILFNVYHQYEELSKTKIKNQKVLEIIEKKKNELNLLNQTIQIYQNPNFLYPFLVRKYGLLKENKYKLYIMEVNE